MHSSTQLPRRRSSASPQPGAARGEALVTRARAYPVTAALLVLVCVTSVLFGLLSTAEQAALLAMGTASPMRVQLWRGAPAAQLGCADGRRSDMVLANGKQRVALSCASVGGATMSLRGLMRRDKAAVAATTSVEHEPVAGWLWLCYCAWWVSNFVWSSIVAVSSGELLIVAAALWHIARDVERAMGVRRYVAVIVGAFVMRMVWFVSVLPLFGARVFAYYTMRPGLAWLCIALYVLHEWGPRHTGRPRKPASRLRLFGKLPLGPELLRAVLLLHLLCRADVYMGTMPGLLYGAVTSSTALHHLHLPRRRSGASELHDVTSAARGDYTAV